MFERAAGHPSIRYLRFEVPTSVCLAGCHRKSKRLDESVSVDQKENKGKGIRKKTLFHGGILSALGHRDYAVLWSGAFISNIGTWVQNAALLWLVKVIIKSNTWVGAVNMANFLPVLFLVPFSGPLADRYNRRSVIIAGQAVMMASAFALGLTATFKADSRWIIVGVVTVSGIAFAMNFPAWQAVLPDLVGHQDILNAIALSSAQFNLARLVGPVIAAIILVSSASAVATRASIAFYLNAVSFLFVIWALLLVKRERTAVPAPTQKIRRDLIDGWKYVWSNRWMVNLLVALSVVSFFGVSYLVLIPAVTRDIFKKGGGSYSVLLMLTGLGAAIGAPLVTYLARFFRETTIMKTMSLALGLFLLAFAWVRIFWLSCIISVGLGLSFMMTGSISNSALQQASTREMRGRVVSFYIMVFLGISALGGEFLGYLADAHSTPLALSVGGLACIATALLLFIFPALLRGAPAFMKKEWRRQFEPALDPDD